MASQVDGVTREASAELLWALDEDKMSVACIILDAIAASPIDCRSVKKLLQGLIIKTDFAGLHWLSRWC